MTVWAEAVIAEKTTTVTKSVKGNVRAIREAQRETRVIVHSSRGAVTEARCNRRPSIKGLQQIWGLVRQRKKSVTEAHNPAMWTVACGQGWAVIVPLHKICRATGCKLGCYTSRDPGLWSQHE